LQKHASPALYNIEVKLKDGSLRRAVKLTKWSIHRLSAYYRNKYYHDWDSISIDLIKGGTGK
jgi:hypothetical protein